MRETAVRDLVDRLGRVKTILNAPREHGTLAAARAVVVPARKPSTYGYGNNGSLSCPKAGGLVPYESEVERAYFRVLEWDYTVDFFAAQPCKIPYANPAGDLRHYFPDVLAVSSKLFVGNASKYEPTIYEIKPRASLAENWQDIRPKLRAAIGFTKNTGLRFKVLTDRLDPTFIQNITFLLGFRGPRYRARTPEERQIVKAIMQAIIPIETGFCAAYILSQLEGRFSRELIIPWIWNLCADYVFQCNLYTPLTLDTTMWRCGDAGEDISNRGLPDSRADWRQPEHDWRR